MTINMSFTKILALAAFVTTAVLAFVGVSGITIPDLIGIDSIGLALLVI